MSPWDSTLGIAALVAISIVASLVSLVLAPAYVGLLGLIPVLIDVKKLFDLRNGDEDDAGGHRAPGSASAPLWWWLA